ncbi:MAG: lytic polysaccharide monooxygenase [Mariniblastus sp.]|nr:lytic polysaccharide monooxygenase [Mariniblastus sp.]
MAKLKCFITCVMISAISVTAFGHGSTVSPKSRVYRVFQSNPENPNFELARNAIEIDSKQAYYTWNQVSQNIPEAVNAGLPAGFDYSPWVPDGRIASGGRYDSAEYGIYTYGGLDQVSNQWPTTSLTAGETITLDFLATAPHEPSVWDVWMTTPDWDANTALNWNQMEFLGRPSPVLQGNHFTWDFTVPTDRSGHQVLWIAWQRDDPVGEVFFSTSDLMITAVPEPSTGMFAGIVTLLCLFRRKRAPARTCV